jgi:hypothetical protein
VSLILVAANSRALGPWDGELRWNVPRRGRGCTLKFACNFSVVMLVDVFWRSCRRFLSRADSGQEYRRKP